MIHPIDLKYYALTLLDEERKKKAAALGAVAQAQAPSYQWVYPALFFGAVAAMMYFSSKDSKHSNPVTPLPKDEADPEELSKGSLVELEHTDDEDEAERIALQHLAEDPHYYSKLETVFPEHQNPTSPAKGQTYKEVFKGYLLKKKGYPGLLGVLAEDLETGEIKILFNIHARCAMRQPETRFPEKYLVQAYPIDSLRPEHQRPHEPCGLGEECPEYRYFEGKITKNNPEGDYYVFCYGSNNPAQLKERLGRERLPKSVGAYAENTARIFVGHSEKWGGAVASLVRQNGKTVYGLVVRVSRKELARLDTFEGVNSGKYKRVEIRVTTQDGHELDAIAYVATTTKRGIPSQKYLKAVAKTISTHWKDSDGSDVEPSDIKINNPSQPYHIEHINGTAPDHESGSPLYDVTKNGIYPQDFYSSEGFRYYGDYGNSYDSLNYSIVRSRHNRPNARVTAYRAVPKSLKRSQKKINPGDWVTLIREVAKEHGLAALNGEFSIISAQIPARSLFTVGDSLLEWGYDPQPPHPKKVEKSDSTKTEENNPIPPAAVAREARESTIRQNPRSKRAYKLISEEDKIAVKELYEDGFTLEDIAEALGVSANLIKLCLFETGTPIRKIGRKPITVDVEKIARLYGEGWTIEEIAEQFGVSTSLIHMRLVKEGEQIKGFLNKKPLDDEEIKTLYIQGSSLSELAKKFNVSPTTIVSRLEEMGVARRQHDVDIPEEEIKTLYLQGQSARKIAKKFGVGSTLVLKCLKNMGVERRPVGSRVHVKSTIRQSPKKQLPDEEIQALYLQGSTLGEIAEKFGVSAATIINRLEAMGVERRSSRKDISDEEIKALYLQGSSLQEIAEKFGVSGGAILKRLEKMGVERRTRGRKLKNPIPPAAVAREAREGLKLRASVAPSKRGGTSVGLARAKQLSSRQNISDNTMKRMRSFFARHEVDKKAKGFRRGEVGYPSKGLQAWKLWGGDAGKRWVKKS